MVPNLAVSILATLILVCSTSAQLKLANTTDAGNGVHVPGYIPANVFEPLQPRLAFAGSGMTVSWSTFTQLDNPQVRYGLRPDTMNTIANATSPSTTYPTSRTWNNHVKITGLEYATKYYYKVSYSDCAYCAYVPTYTFRTAREAGDLTEFTMAIYADMGVMGHDGLSTTDGVLDPSAKGPLGVNETNTVQSLLALADTYEFMALVGDIGYADAGLKEAIAGYFGTGLNDTIPTRSTIAQTYESLLETYFDQMSPITAVKPWMVAPANCDDGSASNKDNPNDEISYDDTICFAGQTNFTFYREHFNMPSDESNGTENFWYSFDYGLVHMIMLDTETDLGHGLAGGSQSAGNDNGDFGVMNAQVDWLVNDLKNVDRSVTPWIIVGLHRPWYTSVGFSAYPTWQEAFEQIFYDYNASPRTVDMYVSGHKHVYERMDPIFNYTIDPNGLNNPRAPWPILNGAAGHYDGLSTFKLNTPNMRQPYSAYGEDTAYGWGRITVHNATHLTYEFVASSNSTVLDSATLYKAHNYSDCLTNSSAPAINGVSPNNVYSTRVVPSSASHTARAKPAGISVAVGLNL